MLRKDETKQTVNNVLFTRGKNHLDLNRIFPLLNDVLIKRTHKKNKLYRDYIKARPPCNTANRLRTSNDDTPRAEWRHEYSERVCVCVFKCDVRFAANRRHQRRRDHQRHHTTKPTASVVIARARRPASGGLWTEGRRRGRAHRVGCSATHSQQQ